MFMIIFFPLDFTSRTSKTLKITQNKRLVILYAFKNTNLPVDITILDVPEKGSLYPAPRPLISVFIEAVEVEHITGIHFSCKQTNKQINKKYIHYPFKNSSVRSDYQQQWFTNDQLSEVLRVGNSCVCVCACVSQTAILSELCSSE